MAFTDASKIPDVHDFHIGFHEIGDLGLVPVDDRLGIPSFHYLVEPWSVWLPVHARPLRNPSFEEGPPGAPTHWMPYPPECTVKPVEGRCRGHAIELTNAAPGGTCGVVQTVDLDQTEPRAIFMSAWSRAEGVTGVRDYDYSLYCDVLYTDGTWLYTQTLDFETGTHDWELQEGWILPSKPIKLINVYCFIRGDHTGTATFDDIQFWELGASLDRVKAARNSGMRDECGHYRYIEGVAPWCGGPAGCVVFVVNPDPEIDGEGHPPTKAHLEWNEAMRRAYQDLPTMEGY